MHLMVLLSVLAVVFCTQIRADPLVVKTNVGTYRGSYNGPKVRSWLGIPFGASTGGSLRFRPPQRAAILPNNGTFNATAYGLGCPQNKGVSYQAFSALTGQAGTGNFSEGDDCLNLNIWSPTNDRIPKNGTSVLVWIYGGSGQYGNSAIPYYNGSNFVRDQENITFVTFNYRTNIFGFPAGAGSSIGPSQVNPGLMDQRMAIDWIYANIRSFGGDPSAITIMGESAGAGAVAIWPYAYEFDPVVRGLIMQSGTEDVFSSTGGFNATLAELAWKNVANATGCVSPGNETFDQFACMQNLPVNLLQDAVSAYKGPGGFNSKVDNVTLFSLDNYVERKTQGRFAKIPVLTGSNLDEGTLFTAPGPLAEAVTLFGFDCPAAAVAQSRTNHSTPAYQYSYQGSFPNINIIPDLGVFHSSEIPMVFGTYNLSTELDKRPPATASQVATSLYMQGAWAAFAREPVNGLRNYGWQQYSNGSSLNVLGGHSTIHSIGPAKANSTSCEALFPRLA